MNAYKIIFFILRTKRKQNEYRYWEQNRNMIGTNRKQTMKQGGLTLFSVLA
jgi:hypothetical protein